MRLRLVVGVLSLLSHGQVRELSDMTCRELGWPVKLETTVCGTSMSDGRCSSPSNASVALRFCQSQGARLCRIDEIRRGAVQGTGCNFDEKRIWSATSCGDFRKFTAAGGGVKFTDKIPEACVDEAVSTDGVNDVYTRCCADEAPPQPTAPSEASCKKLGWPVKGKSCAKSAFGYRDQCLPDMTYAQAWQTCNGLEARLCTEQEIRDGVLIGSQCDAEHTNVWTSTFCPGTNLVKSMGGSLWQLSVFPAMCNIRRSLRRVACCADVAPTVSPTPPPTRRQPPPSLPPSFPPTPLPTLSPSSPPTLSPTTKRKGRPAPTSEPPRKDVPTPSSSSGAQPSSIVVPNEVQSSQAKGKGKAKGKATASPTTSPTTEGKRRRKSQSPTTVVRAVVDTDGSSRSSIGKDSRTASPSASSSGGTARTLGGKKGKRIPTSSPTSLEPTSAPVRPTAQQPPPTAIASPTGQQRQPTTTTIAPTAPRRQPTSPPIAPTTPPTTTTPPSMNPPPTRAPRTIAPSSPPSTLPPSALPSTLPPTPPPSLPPSTPPTTLPPSSPPTLPPSPRPTLPPSTPPTLPPSTRPSSPPPPLVSPSRPGETPSSPPSSGLRPTTTPLTPTAATTTTTPPTTPPTTTTTITTPTPPPPTTSQTSTTTDVDDEVTRGRVSFNQDYVSSFSSSSSVRLNDTTLPAARRFAREFSSEFSRAVRISPRRVSVVQLSPGSIVADFEIAPAPAGSSEPSAAQADAEMKALVANQSSFLYSQDFGLFSTAIPSSYESMPGITPTPAPSTAPSAARVIQLPTTSPKSEGTDPFVAFVVLIPIVLAIGLCFFPGKRRFWACHACHKKCCKPDTVPVEFDAGPSKQRASGSELVHIRRATGGTPKSPNLGIEMESSPLMPRPSQDRTPRFDPNQEYYDTNLGPDQPIVPPSPLPRALPPPGNGGGGDAEELAAPSSSSQRTSPLQPRTPRLLSPAATPPFSPAKTPRNNNSSPLRNVEEEVPQVEYFASEGETDPSLAISLFVFPGKDAEDLPLEQGQRVKVLTRTPANYEGDDWWSGETQDGRQGVFPRIWVLAIGDSVETCNFPDAASNGRVGNIIAIDFERMEVLVRIGHQAPSFFLASNVKLITPDNPPASTPRNES